MSEARNLQSDISRKADNPKRLTEYLEKKFPIPEIGELVANGHKPIGPSSCVLKDPSVEGINPTVNLLISPSATGQDSVLEAMGEIGQPPKKVRTATTRTRRDHEPEGAYVWMHNPDQLSHEDDIKAHLMREYGLAECQEYCGNYYGTPLDSIHEATSAPGEGLVVIKNDQYGARTIQETLEGELDVVTIAMLPESYDQLWNRLQNGRNNPVARLAEAAIFMTEFEAVSNYALINREQSNPRAGAKNTAHELVRIIYSAHQIGYDRKDA